MSRPAQGYWDNGIRVVSVTEAIHESKVRRMMGSPADIERRQRIGSAVHQVTAILDLNGKTWDNAPNEWLEPFNAVSPEVAGFVKAWERFKREMEFIPRLVEHTITPKDWKHPQAVYANFATTLDREGLLRGRPAIVEIKTPKVKEPWWGVQLAGQQLALQCSEGLPIHPPYYWEQYVAQIFADGKFNCIPYTDESYREVFLCSLSLAIWNRRAYHANS
jgi:hypothetical protein